MKFGCTNLGLALVLMAVPASAQEATPKPARALPAQMKSAPAATGSTGAPAATSPFHGITRPMTLSPSTATELTNSILAFDRDALETLVTNDASEAKFVFNLTNVSAAALTITNVAVSCGCTAVELPPLPWLLQPGEHGRLPVTLEVAGKTGVIAKTLQVRTDRGPRTLLVKADIKPHAEPAE